MRIAILVSDNLLPDAENARVDRHELEEEMGKLVPAFAAQGLRAEEVRWRDIETKAGNYDAVLPLFVWDYFEGHDQEFLAVMDEVSKVTHVFNAPETLRWNSNKSYLDELAAKGAPVIRTLMSDDLSEDYIRQAFEELGTDQIVIKPEVGGGAWRQVLLRRDDRMPSPDSLPPQTAMIQPFLPSVQTEGEYSFLYFDGEFSHAVQKRPKSGDYRIQSSYGGTEDTYHPTEDEKANAEIILNHINPAPLYARVDLLRGTDGELKLIELEMIEPYLYLPHAKGDGGENEGAVKLAKVLKRRLKA